VTTEDDLRRAIDADPEDRHTLLVFSDWLRDRGDKRADARPPTEIVMRTVPLGVLIFASLVGCGSPATTDPSPPGRDYNSPPEFGITVSVDGTPWLVGNFSTRDADKWQYLKTTPLNPTKDAKVEPDGKDPSRAELAGRIVIEVQGAGTATVAKLNLVRHKETPTLWLIAPQDADAIVKDRQAPKK
jgi:uncharacterized protein (TIGR02996 family)